LKAHFNIRARSCDCELQRQLCKNLQRRQ
jgi:hypothetical protein